MGTRRKDCRGHQCPKAKCALKNCTPAACGHVLPRSPSAFSGYRRVACPEHGGPDAEATTLSLRDNMMIQISRTVRSNNSSWGIKKNAVFAYIFDLGSVSFSFFCCTYQYVHRFIQAACCSADRCRFRRGTDYLL